MIKKKIKQLITEKEEITKKINKLNELRNIKHIIGQSTYGDHILLICVGDHVSTKYAENGVVIDIINNGILIGLPDGEITHYDTSRISFGGIILEDSND